MACKVEVKALNRLKDKGIISRTREVLDMARFTDEVNYMTDTAVRNYGLGENSELFKVERQEINMPTGSTYRRNNVRTIYRAIPNKEVFETLEMLIERKPNLIPDNNVSDQQVMDTYFDTIDKQSPLAFVYNAESTLDLTKNLQKTVKNKFVKKHLEALIPYVENNSEISFEPLWTMGAGEAFTTGQFTVIPNRTFSLEDFARVYTHELYHVVTLNELRNNKQFKERINNFRNQAIEQLGINKKELESTKNSDFYDKFEQEHYGLLNEQEFLAELFSNSKFSEMLDGLDIQDNKSLLMRILDFIRNLFISKKPTSDNLRELVLESIDNKIEFDKNEVTLKVMKNLQNAASPLFEINIPESEIKRIKESLKNSNLMPRERFEKSNESKEESSDSTIINEKDSTYYKSTQTENLDDTDVKYSDEFQKKINSLDKIIKKIKSDIDSVKSKSAVVRGKDSDITKKFIEINDLINELADTSVEAAIYKFMEFAREELAKMTKSLKLSATNGKLTSDYIFRAKSYTAIYSSLEDIKYVIEIQRKNGVLSEEEFNKMNRAADEAISNLKSFHNTALIFSKDILTKKLAPYNMQPIDDRKRELDKEYNQLYPGKKDKVEKRNWINQKIEDEKEELAIMQREQVRETLDEVPMDIQSMESYITSEKNINSPILKIFSQYIDHPELKHRNRMLKMRNEFYAQQKNYDPKGTSNWDKYKNILSRDKEGNYYFLGEYDPEFLRKHRELRKDLNEAFDNKGKDSDEYKEAYKKFRDWEADNTKTSEIDGISTKPADKWIDKRFAALSGKDKEYHRFMLDKVIEADKNTLGFKSLIIDHLGEKFVKLPAIRRTDLDRILSGQGKSLVKDKLGDLRKIRQDDTQYGELEDIELPNNDEFIRTMTTVNNEERLLVPIHFRNRISPKDQSLDIPTIIMMNSVMADQFKIKHNIEADANLLLDVIGESDVKRTQPVTRKALISMFGRDTKSPDFVRIPGKDSNLYNKLKNIIENRVYNILDASNDKMSKDMINVISNKMMGYTAHLTLAVNWMSAIPNMFQGKIQNWIESVGGTTYGRKDIMWAESTYWKEMTNGGMSDIGRTVNNNKLNIVMDYLDVMTDFSFVKHDFEKNNRFKALFNSNSLHAFNNMAEHYAQSTLALSVMSNIKALDSKGRFLDINGNVTKDRNAAMNLYQAMEIKDGQVEFKKGVITTDYNADQKLSDIAMVQVQNLIRKKVIDLHGQYDSKWQSTLQRYWYGKAITMFRKWLIPGFYRRWRGFYYFKKDYDQLGDNQKYYQLETRSYEEGTYTTFARFMNNIFFKGINELKLEIMSKKWNELSDYEKSNIHKVVKELLITAMMYVAAMMVAAQAKDAPDDDDKELLYTLAYIFRRQESELMQYYSPSDTMRLFRSPFAALSTLEKTANWIGQLMPMNIDDQYVSGERKGQYKAWVKTKKLIPVVAQTERTAENSFNYLQNILSY